MVVVSGRAVKLSGVNCSPRSTLFLTDWLLGCSFFPLSHGTSSRLASLFCLLFYMIAEASREKRPAREA